LIDVFGLAYRNHRRDPGFQSSFPPALVHTRSIAGSADRPIGKTSARSKDSQDGVR
jgi:hypothetical protein